MGSRNVGVKLFNVNVNLEVGVSIDVNILYREECFSRRGHFVYNLGYWIVVVFCKTLVEISVDVVHCLFLGDQL